MQDGIRFRKAHATELAVIADFWLAMFEEIGKHREPEFQPGWRERFAQYFSSRSAEGDAAYFVAEASARIVGCAGAILRDGYPAIIHGIKNGYVLGVYVLPEYRGRAVATKLTRLAIAFLRECGAKTIQLHASYMGRPIYEKLGFIPTNEMYIREIA